MRGCRFGLVRNRVNKADVAAEEFNFLLLDDWCRGACACGNRSLVNGFCGGIAFFNFDGPRASRSGFVLLFSRVEPGICNGRDFECAFFLGVKEYLDILRGDDLVALDLLVDAVFGRDGAEFAKVGEFRVRDGTRSAVTLDANRKCQGFADLEVCAVEVGAKAVVTDHSREIGGFAFGREREYGNGKRGGGGFRFDGFLLYAAARERHATHLLLFFDDFGFTELGVLELEGRNLERAVLGRAEPCVFGGCLHFATGAFDRLEIQIREVVAVDDEIVAGAHVGSLEAALEMLKSVEAEGDAELFAFVNRLFARGKAYGECVVVIGTLHADWNFAADGVGFAVNHPCERSEVLCTCLFRGFNLERIDAGLVGSSTTAEKRVENIVHVWAHHLIGTVEPEEFKVVACFEAERASVLWQFLCRDDELQIECLTRFDAVAIDLKRWLCVYKCC